MHIHPPLCLCNHVVLKAVCTYSDQRTSGLLTLLTQGPKVKASQSPHLLNWPRLPSETPDDWGVSSRHCSTAELNLSAFLLATRLHCSRYLEDKQHWNTTLLKVRCTFSPFHLLEELNMHGLVRVPAQLTHPGSLLYSLPVLIPHRYYWHWLSYQHYMLKSLKVGLQIKCVGSARMNTFWSWTNTKAKMSPYVVFSQTFHSMHEQFPRLPCLLKLW